MLLMLCQESRPLTGPTVIEHVKTVLHHFDIEEELRLQGLGHQTWGWWLLLTDPRSQRYEAWLMEDGRMEIRNGQKGAFLGLHPRDLKDAAMERTAQRWLTAVKEDESPRLVSMTVSKEGIGVASYSITRNGYPFVSYPQYGFMFVFRYPQGDFIALRAKLNPPPVELATPKLDKASALAALKRIWDTEITPAAINERHWRRVWYTLEGEPQLGYFRPEGREKAVLVWKIPYISHRDTGRAIQGSTDGMLIDAVTGTRVRTSIVP